MRVQKTLYNRHSDPLVKVHWSIQQLMMIEISQKFHCSLPLMTWLLLFHLLIQVDSLIQLSQQDVRQLCYDAQKMANSGASDEDIGETLSGRIGGFMRIGSEDEDALPTERLMLKSLAKSLLHRQNNGQIPSSVIHVKTKINSKDSLVSDSQILGQDESTVDAGTTLLENSQSELKFEDTQSKQKYVLVTVGGRRKRDSQIFNLDEKSSQSCSCDSLPSITVDKSRLTDFLENLKNLQDGCMN
ncbi:uncharacterized protein LOC141851064 [Brevipalpus obovatus]|uniref:uncharacterized protein LOC141851064 n=1 Tax=Brevipalpus obovatus TaxID=246614 RepID=UPI003D9DE4B3